MNFDEFDEFLNKMDSEAEQETVTKELSYEKTPVKIHAKSDNYKNAQKIKRKAPTPTLIDAYNVFSLTEFPFNKEELRQNYYVLCFEAEGDSDMVNYLDVAKSLLEANSSINPFAGLDKKAPSSKKFSIKEFLGGFKKEDKIDEFEKSFEEDPFSLVSTVKYDDEDKEEFDLSKDDSSDIDNKEIKKSSSEVQRSDSYNYSEPKCTLSVESYREFRTNAYQEKDSFEAKDASKYKPIIYILAAAVIIAFTLLSRSYGALDFDDAKELISESVKGESSDSVSTDNGTFNKFTSFTPYEFSDSDGSALLFINGGDTYLFNKDEIEKYEDVTTDINIKDIPVGSTFSYEQTLTLNKGYARADVTVKGEYEKKDSDSYELVSKKDNPIYKVKNLKYDLSGEWKADTMIILNDYKVKDVILTINQDEFGHADGTFKFTTEDGKKAELTFRAETKIMGVKREQVMLYMDSNMFWNIRPEMFPTPTLNCIYDILDDSLLARTKMEGELKK